jgi:hypothetical protein
VAKGAESAAAPAKSESKGTKADKPEKSGK